MKVYFSIAMSSVIALCSCNTSVKLTEEQREIMLQSTRTIKTLPVIMDVDKLGNVYVVDVNNQLTLIDNKGVEKYRYSEKRLGNIHSIDVSNPLKILVFHKDFGHIRFLDNTLNIVETLSLTASNKFNTVTLAAWSNDGKIWIFDDQKQKLFKVDKNLNVIVESNHFNDISLNNFRPVKLIERENILAINGNEGNFAIFDNFGQMTKLFDTQKSKDFQFDGENILYLTITGLKNQSIHYPEFTTIGLPKNVHADDIENVKLENNHWYVQYKDGVDIIERSRKK
jgi:hypothetical protein